MDRAWLVLTLLCGCDGVLGLSRIAPVADAIDAPICGTLGEPCCAGDACSDGSSCVMGASGARCLAFAGTYEKTTDTTCGAPACLPNPLTGGCGCPGSFPSLFSAIDEGCGDPAMPSHMTAQMSLCAISSVPANSEWGGAYVAADIAACEPATSPPGCVMPNPMTADCTCPAGAEVVSMRVFLPGIAANNSACPGVPGQPDYLGGTLAVCMLPVAQPISLAGVYQQDHDLSCRTHSSGLAGCSCPSGAVASTLTSIDELGSGFPQTSITFCAVAP